MKRKTETLIASSFGDRVAFKQKRRNKRRRKLSDKARRRTS